MTIKYHANIVQGSDEWYAIRCGLLTASEIKLIMTPTFRSANNEKERGHLYELLAQRITGHVEPQYVSDDMLRGKEDEIAAKVLYNTKYAALQEIGFVTNDEWGFTIGYSPDGLIGDDGLIETKSRRQKYQVETIVESVPANAIPSEFVLQVQTGLLVTRRAWCDFISYSGGLPMSTTRVYPDTAIQTAIVTAATAFESRIAEKMKIYIAVTASEQLIPTERTIRQEMHL